jgi:hypothetical protein
MPDMKAAVAVVTLGFLGALSIPAALLLAGVVALAAAVWEGVRPEVVDFARDASVYGFSRLRELTGIGFSADDGRTRADRRRLGPLP